MSNSPNQPKLEHYAIPAAIEWADLGEPELLLLKIFEDLRFGRVEGLTVRDGKPSKQPPPRVITRFNTAEASDLTEAPHHLCRRDPVLRLFALMRQIGNGTLLVIHVKHGLPVTVEFERRLVEG